LVLTPSQRGGGGEVHTRTSESAKGLLGLPAGNGCTTDRFRCCRLQENSKPTI
jgi:hypothetical protein